MISEQTATARGEECSSKVFKATARGQKVDGIVSGMDEPYRAGSSTDVYHSQGFEYSAPPSMCAVLDLWVDSRSYGQHVPGRWSTLAAGDGRRQQRVRAHLELCQCQSTQGQGRLSANFHGSKLAAVLFGRGLASSFEALECLPFQSSRKTCRSRPNRLTSNPISHV